MATLSSALIAPGASTAPIAATQLKRLGLVADQNCAIQVQNPATTPSSWADLGSITNKASSLVVVNPGDTVRIVNMSSAPCNYSLWLEA
jgi:hypothetical protein